MPAHPHYTINPTAVFEKGSSVPLRRMSFPHYNRRMEKDHLLSVVVPVYNEEEALPLFYEQLREVLDGLDREWEIIFVDDGSKDNTGGLIDRMAAETPAIHAVHFSRNFGHQAALCAGLERAKGEYTITMDGDGQHPPKLIPQMISLAESGYDIILTQRIETEQKNSFKKWSSETFRSEERV